MGLVMEYISFAAVWEYSSSALLILLLEFGTHDFVFFFWYSSCYLYLCYIRADRWADGVLCSYITLTMVAYLAFWVPGLSTVL